MPETIRSLDFMLADDLENIDEQMYVARFQNGDVDAFNTLVMKYQDRIAKLIYKNIKDIETTKDISQEVFLKAYKALPKFKGDSAFYSWLYRIAINCCIDYMRQQNRRQTVLFDDLTSEPDDLLLISKQPSPSDQVEMTELGEIIQEAVKQLPPKQQRVFKLRYDQMLQMKEIAVVTNRSEGTVKTHLYHAHRKLRELLRPYLENRPLKWNA